VLVILLLVIVVLIIIIGIIAGMSMRAFARRDRELTPKTEGIVIACMIGFRIVQRHIYIIHNRRRVGLWRVKDLSHSQEQVDNIQD
jgi:hypothetical protein